LSIENGKIYLDVRLLSVYVEMFMNYFYIDTEIALLLNLTNILQKGSIINVGVANRAR